jgi:ABC-type Fe3+ transport system substrate-binding protein
LPKLFPGHARSAPSLDWRAKHAGNPNAAKLFAAFLVTREGQDIIYKHERTDLHYLEGSRVARQLSEIQKETGQRFGDYSAQRILDQQNVDTVLKKLR